LQRLWVLLNEIPLQRLWVLLSCGALDHECLPPGWPFAI
jgi:hypothetical protein